MKRRLLTFSLFLLAGLLPASAAELKPLISTDLDLDALKSWNVQTYRVGHIEEKDGKTSVTMPYKAFLGTVVQEDRIVLRDTWDINDQRIRYEIFCKRDNFLSVELINIWIAKDGKEQVKSTVRFKDGKALIAMEENRRQHEEPYPAYTMMTACAQRLVTLLPRTPGVSYTFDSYSELFQIGADNAEKGTTFAITCLGRVKVKVAGKSMVWHKFRLQAGRHDLAFYVDNNGVLQRMRDRETVIDLFRK